MLLIGLVGGKGVGKSTAASYLCENHGFVEYAIADPLKQTLMHMFSLTRRQLYGDLKEVVDPRWNVTPRTIMQRFGTDIVRNNMHEHFPEIEYNRSHWLKLFEMNRESLGNYVVVSDVRFADEATAIRDMGGMLIYISRSWEGKSVDEHESEKQHHGILTDVVVNNDKSISDFLKQISNIVKE